LKNQEKNMKEPGASAARIGVVCRHRDYNKAGRRRRNKQAAAASASEQQRGAGGRDALNILGRPLLLVLPLRA
jgi:hypothetical protein